ncbi:hypothetical protein Salat_1376000 [Sesamum alatum]|uniref:DUF7950 domain-containing protein n=1 Tax=Sesamum alatum TaxID=300844 RepID=A0AAE1Y9L3_9LAMI|nr:hypothetical protein Salat_1376000 [Sesamum alatum]
MCSWPAKSFDNPSVINRIMLRFRPIAPKPVGVETASGTADQDRGNGAAVMRRTKRKYVRVRGRQSRHCAREKISTEEKTSSAPENSGTGDDSSPEKEPVTLQLLPERSETDHRNSYDNISPQNIQENRSIINRYNEVDENVNDDVRTADSSGGRVDLRGAGSVIETWIIVECVTDKCSGVGLGFSDKEKMYNLEKDTCPGFISDWTNKVIWVNEAYKKMVAAEEEEAAAAEKGFLVWLVVKEELPHLYPSFACRLRVIQQRGRGHKWNKIVPCDVWRMEFSGFAWKLDVNTALSLSL